MPDAELTTDEVIRIAERRLQNAHRARRAREHLLDDIRRALCDIGFMDDDDPFGHADLADVIRQNMPNDEPVASQRDDLKPVPAPLTHDHQARCISQYGAAGTYRQCVHHLGHPGYHRTDGGLIWTDGDQA